MIEKSEICFEKMKQEIHKKLDEIIGDPFAEIKEELEQSGEVGSEWLNEGEMKMSFYDREYFKDLQQMVIDYRMAIASSLVEEVKETVVSTTIVKRLREKKGD